ncbi:MAG: RluA family pseudouridine synthase [Bacillota bacterium]
MQTKTFTIDSELAGMRIDKALATLDEDLSRSYIKTLIDSGHVTVNNAHVKPNTKVHIYDKIVVSILDPEILDITPVNLDLDIVYQDDDVVVVNKPSGMVVHPAKTVKEATLVHGLMYEIDDLQATNDTIRPGIVHRIDKDTSGLLVVAKNEAALKHLQSELKKRKMTRKYVALVEGVIQHNKGKVDAPIGRDKKDRKKMAITSSGKQAVTYFDVLERFDDATLIECTLETGRTHQIRVHLSYINHPIVGDPKYGRRKTDTEYGQYLHAKTLGFTHPTTHKMLTFDSDIPDFFKDKLTALRG